MTWVIGNFRSSLSLFIGLALDCEINEHWIVCSCTCITLFFLFSRSQSENQVRRGQTGRGADDREKTSSSATMQRAMPFTDGLAQSETKRTLGAPPRIDELGRILGERGAHRKAKGSVRARTKERHGKLAWLGLRRPLFCPPPFLRPWCFCAFSSSRTAKICTVLASDLHCSFLNHKCLVERKRVWVREQCGTMAVHRRTASVMWAPLRSSKLSLIDQALAVRLSGLDYCLIS